MPVFNPKPTAPPVAVDSPVQSLAPENKNILVDSRYIPMTALLSHVEGSPWMCDYYAQVLDKDTALSGQQLNRLGINQQYRLVQQFELRVTSPLQGDQDTESNAMPLEGVSNVFPCLVPNVGDMFIADIGDGRLGVFQVTESKRKSVMKDTIHEISYQWVAYATKERLDDLNNKVVKKNVFVLDLMINDKDPFLADEDYKSRSQLAQVYRELVPMYFRSFYDHEFATLMVPDQDSPTYDPLLVAAVLSIVDTSQALEIAKVRRLNVDDDEALTAVNVWTVLLERSKMQQQRAFTRASTTTARAFMRLAQFEGIYHSGVHYVVYPIDPERSISPRRLLNSKVLTEPIQRPEYDDFVNGFTVPVLSGLDNVEGHAIQPSIPAAGATDYYVFSEAFYDGLRKDQSRLENLVQDYIDEVAIDPAALLKIVRDYPNWATLDQFYYGPVVMLLMRHVVERF